jgi:hypothetical protein
VFALGSMDLERAMEVNSRRERHARELTQQELADRTGRPLFGFHREAAPSPRKFASLIHLAATTATRPWSS